MLVVFGCVMRWLVEFVCFDVRDSFKVEAFNCIVSSCYFAVVPFCCTLVACSCLGLSKVAGWSGFVCLLHGIGSAPFEVICRIALGSFGPGSGLFWACPYKGLV